MRAINQIAIDIGFIVVYCAKGSIQHLATLGTFDFLHVVGTLKAKVRSTSWKYLDMILHYYRNMPGTP